MPTLTAATESNRGMASMTPFFLSSFSVSYTATYAPVIDAVLVPPSACITSQSIYTVLSPNAFMSATARMLLPMSLCISWVLPPSLPETASRIILFFDDLGSIAYSAVSQPFPVPARKGGTLSSTVAAQMTFVSPISIRTEPSANLRYSLVILTGRSSSVFLPSVLLCLAADLNIPSLPRDYIPEVQYAVGYRLCHPRLVLCRRHTELQGH